jgi:hypothetical protein
MNIGAKAHILGKKLTKLPKILQENYDNVL